MAFADISSGPVNSGGMLPAQRLRIALAAGLAHWALLIAIQAGSFCAYLMPAGSLPEDAVSYLATIPLIQGQAILVAAALGALAWLLAARRAARWLILPVQLVLTAFVLADQIFYKIFFDHLRPSLFEVGRSLNVRVAMSSLSTETDMVFYIAVFVAVLGEAWLVWTLVRLPQSKPSLIPLGAATVLLLASWPALTSTRYYHLNEHPAVVAALDWKAGSLVQSMQGRKRAAKTSPSAGESDIDLRLSELAKSSLAGTSHPNVVMVVMESVGARTLLGDDGMPSPLYAPSLAKLARRSLVFDSMYVPYPATTRSLVSLHTGGRLITGSPVSALESLYQGPMLGRALQHAGYTTALFSSERLDVEDCDAFLKQAGYDKFQDFQQDVAGHFKENEIHSWGAKEEYTVGLMDQWLDGMRGAGKPFYMEYMTVATHHPYGAPAGYSAPYAGKDALSQYRNSLHYTDRAIGTLLELLVRKGLLQNTIIVVTGDHGESFGGAHPLNLVHKNFLFEENVRGFALIADPRWKLGQPVRSSRVISNGDLMPTLMTLVGVSEPASEGRDLLVEQWPARPVFFHKLALPEQWGLRDGKWKFIGEIRNGKAELYDLDADPQELNNLAAKESARVAEYTARCEEWFIRSDAEYLARLKDYHPPGGRTLRPEEYREPGPKLQSTGFRDNVGNFVESSNIARSARATAWNHWVPDGNARHSRWQWTSPSGKESWTEIDLQKDWETTYANYMGNLPMEPGLWSVRLWFGNKPGLISRFKAR